MTTRREFVGSIAAAAFAPAALRPAKASELLTADRATASELVPADRVVKNGRLRQSVSRWPYAKIPLPEFCRAAIPGKRLISNPGCYPTAANLALRPLVEAGVIDRDAGIICDAKSGVSGAGRKPSLKTSFVEVTENFSAYAVLEHRHVPEILCTSGLEESELSFTAQLLPIERGILETIYFRVKNDVDLVEIYQNRYRNEPFVRIYPRNKFPDLHAVARTNFCDIGVTLDAKTGRAVVVAAIDNLVKGAAGMAVQNMNLALGFPETTGLQ